MAKEFKDWDKRFSKAQLDAERTLWGKMCRANITTRWPYFYNQPNSVEARHAAYTADGHFDWQRFRVSLKGLSTLEKLRRLEAYMQVYHDSPWCMTRVNNYIGALLRGGQLNKQLEIVK